MFKNIDTVQSDIIAGIISHNEYLDAYNSNEIDKERTVLISITNPDSSIHPDLKVQGFDDVLHTQFWDVEDSIGRFELISDDEALRIRKFIVKNKNKKFLIHCAAGQSRSAAVGMAVECLLNYAGDKYSYGTGWSDIRVHKTDRYSPNLGVYDQILKDLYERTSYN